MFVGPLLIQPLITLESRKSPNVEEPTGTYSLKVTSDTTLQDRHSDVLSGATYIGYGNSITGAISPSDDYDYFEFEAQKGVTYDIDVALGTAEGVRFSVENQAYGYSTSNFGLRTSLKWEAPQSLWVQRGNLRFGPGGQSHRHLSNHR